MERHLAGGGAEKDPDEEEIDVPEELDDLDPDELPKILNAKQLDRVTLGLGQLLAMRFSGRGITRRGASLQLAAELFAQLHRYFTAAQPIAAGLEVALRGSPPHLPGIQPPLLQGAVSGQSITVVLGISGIEARRLGVQDPTEREFVDRLASFPKVGGVEPDELAAEFPTFVAASWLTEMLSSEPDEAVEQVQSLGRRTTRDFLKIIELIADQELETQVRSHDREQSVVIPSARAFATATTLKQTEEQSASRFTVTGALYQADARNDRFRLITENGDVFAGNYVPGMTSLIRDAWAKLVRAKLVRIDFQWVGANEPHRTVYELEAIERVIGDAEDLLEH
jgi:hypothetical protein